MNILFVTHYSSMYGANKSLFQLIIDLREKYDISPIVLVPEEGELIQELKKEKIEYIISKFYPWVYKGKIGFIKGIIKEIINIYYLKKILFKIKNIPLHLVHTNSSVVNIGAKIAKNQSLKHIWHIREYGKEDYNLDFLYGIKNAGKYFEKNSDKVISISESITKKYSKYISESKIKTIHNGITTKLINFNDKKVMGKINFGVLGLLHENKNQLEILKAIKILKEKYQKEDFTLQIIGSGDISYENLLKKFVKDNNLRNFVIFLGYKNDIKEVLKDIDIGIISSKKEAFGRVTIEFMLNKIPVIGTNSGGTKEILNEECGFLYEVDNPQSLASYMNFFIENKIVIKEKGKKAQMRALENFTSEKNSEKIYELYKSILEGEN